MTSSNQGKRRTRKREEPRAIYTRTARRRRRHKRRRNGSAIALVIGAVVLLGLVVWTVAKASQTGPDQAKQEGVVKVLVGGRVQLRAPAARLAALSAKELARRLKSIPTSRRQHHGRATITLVTRTRALQRLVRRAASSGGGTVVTPERPTAASLRLAVVKQALHNNCETAALSMLLLAGQTHVGQLRLQSELARSGPLDPKQSAGLPLWGDPDAGFVGRVGGGGTSGGFGVYQRPVVRLARRHGLRLSPVGRRPRDVYRELLRGRPVMAWVGLSNGPFMTWRTASGKRITGNFGEHTVVLTGIAAGSLAVNDPLSGRRLNWSRSQFELMWQRLGRRALKL